MDISAIRKVTANYIDIKIDILGALKILQENDLISECKYKTLVQKYSTGVTSQRFLTFVWDVLELVSFLEFIKFLYTVNCVCFADELQAERFGRQIHRVDGRHVPGGSQVVKHYTMMKSLSDDNMLHDRREALSEFATRIENELPLIENMAKKQLEANKYATIMQLRTTFHQNNKTKEKIIVKMRTNIPREIDSTYSAMLYHSNFGVACAQNGNEAGALDHIREVKALSFKCRSPFIHTFSYYYLHYIFRCLYSKNPCQENLNNVLVHCHLGLNVLTEMNQSDVQLIRRVFLLNLIQTLLGIREDFSINHAIQVDDSHLNVAEQYLNKLAENFDKIESRREMIYCLCRAKTLQDADIFLAMTYLDRALALSNEGAYLQTNVLNIAAYQNWLLLRELPQDI